MGSLSAVISLVKMRCPQCRQGKMFSGSLFSPARFDAMFGNCPYCGLRYERELGFYWGSMYISYGLSVGIVFIIGVGLYYLAHDPPVWVYMSAVVTAIVLLTPLLFR